MCESPVTGVVQRVLADAGDTKPVGALLAVIAEAGAAESAIDAFIDKFNAEFVVEQERGGGRSTGAGDAVRRWSEHPLSGAWCR